MKLLPLGLPLALPVALLLALPLVPRGAESAPASSPTKPAKKSKKQLAEEKALMEAHAKAEADAKAATEAKARAEAAEEQRRLEAAKAEAARVEAEAASQAASLRAAEEEAQRRAEAEAQAASQAASQRALEDERRKSEGAASQAAADAAEAQRKADDEKKITKELFYARAQLGTERFAVPFLRLADIDVTQKRGFGFSFGGAAGLRLGITRLGLEYQRTMLPAAASFNKFMLGLDIVIPVWMVEIYARVALGYGLLAADASSYHGGVGKIGAGVDFRFHQFVSAGLGADFDAQLYYLGLLAQGSLGATLWARVTLHM